MSRLAVDLPTGAAQPELTAAAAGPDEDRDVTRERPGFEEFVATRWASLARFGYLLCGDAATGEDLAQEALVRAWARWSRIEESEEAYVRRIMARLAWKRRRLPQDVPLLDTSVAQPDPSHASGRTLDVARALAGLPRDQRIVVVMRHWLDMSEAQIADAVGCRPGTVKSRASRAADQLRSVLGDYEMSVEPNGVANDSTSSENQIG